MSAILKTSAKPKRCKARGCTETFVPWSSLQIACSPKCGISIAQDQAAKREKRERIQAKRARRERLQQLKPLRKLLAEAQQAFNSFVRERDHGQPCICCGKFPTNQMESLRGHLWDAGHWRSIGAAPQLRFNEDNVHRQLVQCNRDKSGNALKYRDRLVNKIGLARVEALEADNTTPKWDRDWLIELTRTYRRRTRELIRRDK